MHVLTPIRVGVKDIEMQGRGRSNTTGIKSSVSKSCKAHSQRIPGHKLVVIIMSYKVIFILLLLHYILLLFVNCFVCACVFHNID